jgi:hypothetical protein
LRTASKETKSATASPLRDDLSPGDKRSQPSVIESYLEKSGERMQRLEAWRERGSDRSPTREVVGNPYSTLVSAVSSVSAVSPVRSKTQLIRNRHSIGYEDKYITQLVSNNGNNINAPKRETISPIQQHNPAVMVSPVRPGENPFKNILKRRDVRPELNEETSGADT